MTPTEIAVTPLDGGVSRVTYSADIRVRIQHMTERDASFVTLDQAQRGMGEGLGLYDYVLLSDIVSLHAKYADRQWSISAPFQFKISLPSLTPLTTVYYARLSVIQTPSVRSPRDSRDTPALTFTEKYTLAELGERPPAGHTHPGKDTKALWRGPDAGGKGGGDGWEGQVWGRLPEDRYLRPSTVAG